MIGGATEPTLPAAPREPRRSCGWKKRFRVLLLSSLFGLLCLVIADFMYCAHIRRRIATRAQIGYGTTLTEIVRLLGEPDVKEAGKWNKWVYQYYEPEIFTADSIIVWFLLSGNVEFRRWTFTIQFEEAGMGMRVSTRYESN